MKFRINAMFSVKNSATLIRYLLEKGFKIHWYNADGTVVVVTKDNQDNLFISDEHDYFKARYDSDNLAVIDQLWHKIIKFPTITECTKSYKND